MSIYDQGYQHWEGTFRPHSIRWLVIATHGLRGAFRSKSVRRLTFLALFPSFVLIAFLSIWGLIEQEVSWGAAFAPILRMFGFPESILSGPKGHRLMVWTFAFNVFLGFQTIFWVLTLLVVGPRLISQDLRANALPLYLSRPLNRWDYFLGKFAVVAACIGGVTVLPLSMAYLFGLLFSFDPAVIGDTIGLFAGSLAYCLVLIASAGALILAISSLTNSSLQVSMIWIMLWLLSAGLATAAMGMVRGITRGDPEARDRFAWVELISYNANLYRVRQEFLGTERAWESLRELSQQDFAKMFPARRFGRPGGPGGPMAPLPPTPPPPPLVGPDRGELTPIRWSAGVLGGLFLASAAILATRIRGMDRLR